MPVQQEISAPFSQPRRDGDENKNLLSSLGLKHFARGDKKRRKNTHLKTSNSLLCADNQITTWHPEQHKMCRFWVDRVHDPVIGAPDTSDQCSWKAYQYITLKNKMMKDHYDMLRSLICSLLHHIHKNTPNPHKQQEQLKKKKKKKKKKENDQQHFAMWKYNTLWNRRLAHSDRWLWWFKKWRFCQ